MPAAAIGWLDFDVMLRDLASAIVQLADHLVIPAPREAIEAIVAGSLMTRYSKALEYDYSPALRAELLADAARRNRADISAAMAALQAASTSVPLLRQALDRSGGEG